MPKSPKIAKKSEPQTFEVKKNRGSGGIGRQVIVTVHLSEAMLFPLVNLILLLVRAYHVVH